MKTRIYLRIAQGSRKGFKVEASSEPVHEPIKTGNTYQGYTFLPTVSFAVDFNIPDDLFKQAEKPVAEINIAMKEANVEGHILIPAIQKTIKELKKTGKN